MPEPLSRSHSGILDDLMPKPLSLRKQEPKKQGMSCPTTKDLTMMAQEQALQRPPHPTDQQNQSNFNLHDKHPEQNPVVLMSLELVPLHLMSDHGERLTSIHQCRYLDQAKAEKISEWVEYPAPGKQGLMPQWAGHEIPAIQATLRAILGERYEPLNSFVEDALQMVAMGDESESRPETDGDEEELDWLDDVTDLLYLARKEW